MTGRSVRLRPFGSEPDDHERLVAWRREPGNARWFASGARPTLESHLAWFERLQADPAQLYWAIDAVLDPACEPCDPPAHIGAVGLILGAGGEVGAGSEAGAEGEFARYLVGETAYRGRGHAAEGAYLVLAYAFDDLRLRRVTAEYVAGNVAVSKLYPRFGFRVEDERDGMVRMSLDVADFAEVRPGLRCLMRLDERSGV